MAESSTSVTGGKLQSVGAGPLTVIPETGRAPEPTKKTVSGTLTRISERFEQHTIMLYRKSRAPGYPRAAVLNIKAIYIQLVGMYAEWFKTQYFNFTRVSNLPLGGADAGSAAMANVYVSAWIHDLYYCLYHATKDVAGLLFNEKFTKSPHGLMSNDYDTYLATLNIMIRPTLIRGTLEETLFVPVFPDHDFSKANPFEIQGYSVDRPMFHSIIGIMREKRIYSMAPINTSARYGRASWLLEFWDNDKTVHAFFPLEGNCSNEDIIPVLILGVQLTRYRLGPVDIDDWQRFPNNQVPMHLNPADYRRVRSRSFFGAVEEREFRHKTSHEPFLTKTLVPPVPPGSTGSAIVAQSGRAMAGKKRKLDATGAEFEFSIVDDVGEELFEIRDYCYYVNICEDLNANVRFLGHREMTIDITTLA